MWLAVEDRLASDTLFIGQAHKLPNGTCIRKKVEARDEMIAGTQFTRGDYAITVKWWKKTSDDPEERTYEQGTESRTNPSLRLRHCH